MNQIKKVFFANKELEESYNKLKEGKFEEKQLYNFINRAIEDLKQNPFCSIKIPKRLWSNKYIKDYGITNLWKYNLPNSWRLVYTIFGSDIKIVSMILEWLNHKDYEKRFKY